MIITANQKKLSTVLKNAERVISKGHSLPILQSVLLKTEKGVLKVAATNLELGVTYFINVKIDKEDRKSVV